MHCRTDIDLTDGIGDTYVHAAATSFARNPDWGPPPDDVNGHIGVGPLTIHGTPDQLRALAKVIDDAAMEMERIDAEARTTPLLDLVGEGQFG